MKCAVHPEAEASGFCRNCGKPMCPVCVRAVKDVLYCEDCLAQVMGLSTPAPAGPGVDATGVPPVPPVPGAPPAQSGANPGLAFLLGLVPGLGAVYNGEYNKALLHIVIFAAIIVGVSSLSGALQAFFIVAICIFPFYMAIDATRVAKARATGTMSQDPFEAWSKNRPIGPIILIGVGALVLLNNLGVFENWQVQRLFWPLVLIGVGALMLRNRIGGQS